MAPQAIDPALEARLGYRFTNKALLLQALTHSSLAQNFRDNERLEFLGDRVLGLAVADRLFRDRPDLYEGDLALHLNAVVRRETLAAAATELGLGGFLRLGRGEAGSGGRVKPAILADALEAVFAAIYLDGGFDAARDAVIRLLGARLADAALPPRDAKTRLQEWAQGAGHGTPRYAITGKSGPDHAPSFTVTVSVGQLAPAEGDGPSRRLAEQKAASALLILAGVETPSPEQE